MTAADLLSRAQAAGLTLWRDGDRLKYRGPQSAIDAMLPELREHKPELMKALPDAKAEARRKRVLAMLEARPEARYAAVTDSASGTQGVILTMAIRGVGTCELCVSRDKWDGVLFFDLLERHGTTVH